MEMSQAREHVEWYSEFFHKYVEPVLVKAGFTKREAGFWGLNSFRKPFLTVLESVGRKACDDTLTAICMVLVPMAIVLVGTLSTCKWVSIFTGSVELAAAYLVFALSMYLFRNSFPEGRPLCEAGMSVYSGETGAVKFLKRYSDYLVLMAIHEAGKIAGRFSKRRNGDAYADFCAKLFNFEGFCDDETEKQD